jgi:gamma-glutamyltranspeptidase/glutathione hydrolase
VTESTARHEARQLARWRPMHLAIACALTTACGPVADRAADDDARPLGRVATSTQGMVVSGSEPATRVGADVLASGGNAVDAAIATAFTLAVTEPTQSGLGGRTQALVWRPDGPPFGIDATNEVPASYDPDSSEQVDDGYGVIAVPGTVAGLARLHALAGSLPLSRLVEPAATLAERGFSLSAGEAGRLSDIRDRLALSPGASAAFLASDGSALAPGDTLRQPILAEVLRAIAAEGPEVFYRGWIADRMTADIGEHEGYVTAEDLAGYEADESIVVDGRFGDLRLLGTYIPASGATAIEALQILDHARRDPGQVGLAEVDGERRAFSVGRALEMAYEDRETAWNDERPPSDDAAWITSVELAAERARRLTAPAMAAPGMRDSGESPNTTHLSVVDADGMAVAMTQSLGPTGGSRVATEGLGYLYAATLGGYLGYLEPGDRPWSSQSPLIALRGERPAYVMGGAGARRIISALVGTIIRLEVEGMSVEEAIAAPRLHPAASAWRFERAAGSNDPPGAALARAAGHEVRVLPIDDYFARLNVIAIDPATGTISGIADPRWAWGAASGPGGGR